MVQTLSPGIILALIAAYFGLLMTISYYTGRKASNSAFFLANRQSPWIVVAVGMIGASLSGVTFISIPGVVGAGGLNQQFSYMQVVLGYLLGYIFIAQVLLPLYYRLNLTSIYGYLEQRFGFWSYKTGAAFFLLSRSVGAAFRLYLVALVLDGFVTGPMGLPFAVTVALTIALIWVYTFRGGINTIIWTDTLQTVGMIGAVLLTVMAIGASLDLSLLEIPEMIRSYDLGQVFFFEGGWSDPNNFFKQFLSGALITIVMTGLDQDMMQKNLSCRSLGDAQKNMYTFSGILFFVNVLFLAMGALLYIYAQQVGIAIPAETDKLYPSIALQHLSPVIGVAFVIGLIAAAYSSADSALTALTTSFCVDFLDFEKEVAQGKDQKRTRFIVHFGFSTLLLFIILIFRVIPNQAVINQLFIAAGYTYGPLLGLYAFGLFTRLHVRDKYVLVVCLLSPVLSWIINYYSELLLGGFQFGFLILALNGILTFTGLLAISYKEYELPPDVD